jgi:hypothetical protein
MPPCFSRPICLFAMYLNNFSNDVDPQSLLPYVARLACADTDEIEHRTQSYISSRMMPFRPLAKGIEILEGAPRRPQANARGPCSSPAKARPREEPPRHGYSVTILASRGLVVRGLCAIAQPTRNGRYDTCSPRCPP